MREAAQKRERGVKPSGESNGGATGKWVAASGVPQEGKQLRIEVEEGRDAQNTHDEGENDLCQQPGKQWRFTKTQKKPQTQPCARAECVNMLSSQCAECVLSVCLECVCVGCLGPGGLLCTWKVEPRKGICRIRPTTSSKAGSVAAWPPPSCGCSATSSPTSCRKLKPSGNTYSTSSKASSLVTAQHSKAH